MKWISVIFLAALAVGCGRETRPFNHAIGTLTVEGVDYHSVVITSGKPDGIHLVGGFISDAPIGKITIGPKDFETTSLQIIPSQGVVVHNGKKHTVEEDGHLIWIIEGESYEQPLSGFPLEQKLKKPKEIPHKPDAGDGS